MKRLLFVGMAVAFAFGANATTATARSVMVQEVRPSQVLFRQYAVHVDCRTSVSLSFPVGGKLAVRQVYRDTEVKKGDVLAELDAEEFHQRVAKAKIAAARAEATYQRMVNVPKGVSKEALSQAQSAMMVAAAELRIAEKSLADTKIIAPFDGIVVNIDGEIGQYVTAGQMVTRLHSKAVDIVLAVPERMICRADWRNQLDIPGVEVEIAACPGMRLPVKFLNIDLLSDNGTQSYRARFTIDTPDGYSFFEGMSATLYMPQQIPEGEKRFDIDSDGLCRRADGTSFVWCVMRDEDGKYRCRQRTVNVCARNFNKISVVGELAEGEMVAVLGSAYLAEGLVVNPVRQGAQ